MWLIVGLGNPGDKYKNNRHNIGFMAVDSIADRYGFSSFKSKFQGMLAEGRIGEERVLLLKPSTYMNESGRSVGEAARFYKIPSENIIVIYDELDLVPCKLRVKRGGGTGGHNGVKSIDAHLSDKNYWKIRLGIGRPEDKGRVSAYVLSDFSKEDKKNVEILLDEVARYMNLMIKGDDALFMNRVSEALR